MKIKVNEKDCENLLMKSKLLLQKQYLILMKSLADGNDKTEMKIEVEDRQNNKIIIEYKKMICIQYHKPELQYIYNDYYYLHELKDENENVVGWFYCKDRELGK